MEAQHSYTLDAFEKHANKFLREHFGGREPDIPELEREFWRLVTQAHDQDVRVF